MLDKNTPSKPQRSEASPKNRTREGSKVMSTPNVTPQPSKGGGKQQKNSNEHIAVVLQEAAFKLTRKLTEEESGIAWKFAAAADHEITADEVLAAINEPVPQRPGNGKTKSRKVDVTADRLIRDVEETLRRELTPAEQGTIQGGINDLRGETLMTKTSYAEAVRQYAAQFKEVAEEAAEETRFAEEQAHPPVERWTKEATELGTTFGAKIGTFKAMATSVQSVNDSFSALQTAIEERKLPADARIMPTHTWKKTTKDGKHTTDHKGFLYFQDYCQVILKRGKSAVYQMLKDAKMPREKKDPDNSLGTLVKRGSRSFIGLHKKLSDKDKKETSFDGFMELVVKAARAILAAELDASRQDADDPVAATTAKVRNETVQGEVLPPSQDQAK